MSKMLAVAALSGVGLMTGIGTAAEAGAREPVTGVIKSFATAYSSPTNQSSEMYVLESGTSVDTYCYREGQAIGGDPRWLIINAKGTSAYVHLGLISVDPVPHC